MWVREEVRSKVCLFGLRQNPQNFTISPSLHQCRRAGEIIPKLTHLRHPSTGLERQNTSLDTSGAGAVDSISAVGSSGHRKCVNVMHISRKKLQKVSMIK